MKLVSRLLAHSGIIIAVSAVILGASAVQAAHVDSVKGPQRPGITAPNKPSSDGPLEERLKRAIEEIDQKGQTALAELGELDSGEKIDRAEQILEQMAQATREVKRQSHDRTAERFLELNDIAVATLEHTARTELQELGERDSEEKRQRADEIRARLSEQRERLANSWSRLQERLEQRHQQRELPEFTIRQPNGRPPAHAVALGLRARTEDLSKEEVDALVLQLDRDARSALDNLGELDTPEKIERARFIRSRLEERIKEVREKATDRVRDKYEEQVEQQIQRLRLRAEAAVKELGELDTPEKQERAEVLRSKIQEQENQLRERLANRARNMANDQFEQQATELRRQAQAALEELGEADSPQGRELARSIRARLDEQLSGLRGQLSDRSRLALEEQVDQETSALRRRAQASLERLGELDTPEKQEMARLIRARLEEQVQSVKERLSLQARASYDDQFQQESEELQRLAQAALRELGRVDSLEKVERARQIRARLEDDVNRLKREQVQRHRDGVEQRSDLRPGARPDQVGDAPSDRARDNLRTGLQDQRNRADEIRDRTADALRQNQEQRDQLSTRADNLRDRLQDQTRQVIRQDTDSSGVRPRPAEATPEPTREPPKTAEERPASDGNARP
jgi:hypothetical protein